MLPPGISSASDLITDRDITRAGFLSQALAKVERADAHVAAAKRLWAELEHIPELKSLPAHVLSPLQTDLLAAAGFSDKALNNLKEYRARGDLQPALDAVLKRIEETSPDNWRAEVLFRFLLTKGDSLGGSMRNVTGARGGTLFA